MKDSLLKIYLACALAAFFAACSTPTVSSDEDDDYGIIVSSVKEESSSSKAELSSGTEDESSSSVKSSSSSEEKKSSSSKEKSSSSKTELSSEKENISSSSVESSSSKEVYSSADMKSVYDAVEESGLYTTKDSVAAYLCKFDKLPANYVGKNTGKQMYESETGNTFEKWNFNPWTTIGVMIGGDNFDNFASNPDNYHATLPEGSYHEADVEYSAKNRGTKRLVYQADCVIYYTADHYESFTKLEVR